MASANLIARCDNHYLLQRRDVSNPEFQDGHYPFIFPGAYSLFGGDIEEGETPLAGFRREMGEELPALKQLQDENFTSRSYHWERDLPEVLGRIDQVFKGNMYAFLGFDFEAVIPECARGNGKIKARTYHDFFLENQADHFYIADLNQTDVNPTLVEEGKSIWLPDYVARSLVMVPSDKVALLDDIAQEVIAGRIKL